VSATEQFAALVRGPEDAMPLDTACLLIAAHARPAADPGQVIASGHDHLDALAAGCPGSTLDDVRAHLFGAVGFTGNRRRYDDPRNSFLDEVLERRLGIPITLAVVVIEVGRRLGLDLQGVGMPGHFLVEVEDGRYLDAFDGGRLLDVDGCRRRFNELAGPGAPWSTDLLAPVGPRDVVSRVLANLRALFAQSQDIRRLDWVLELRLAIPGVPERERAERASVLAALGRYDEAADQLEHLADAEASGASVPGRHPSSGPDAGDEELASELRARAARLRARLN
jgi:regulator of sirC expression with transglutaminase-like and TPR domain